MVLMFVIVVKNSIVILPKTFNYVDYQLLQFKPHLCQDEYYRSNNYKILIKPSPDKKSCLHCHSLNQKIVK